MSASSSTMTTTTTTPKIIIKDEDFPSLPIRTTPTPNQQQQQQQTAVTTTNAPTTTTKPTTTTTTEESTNSVEFTPQNVLKMTKDKRQQTNAVTERLQHLYKELKLVSSSSTILDEHVSLNNNNNSNSSGNSGSEKEEKVNDKNNNSSKQLSRLDRLNTESQSLKNDIKQLKQQVHQIEQEKQQFTLNREQLKKQMDDEKNNASLKTEIKEKKYKEMKDKEKIYKKAKKRNADRRSTCKYFSEAEYDRELVELENKLSLIKDQQQKQQKQKGQQKKKSNNNNKAKKEESSEASDLQVNEQQQQQEELQQQIQALLKEKANYKSYLHAWEKQVEMQQGLKSLKNELNDLEVEIKTSTDNHKKLVRAVEEAYLTSYINDQLPSLTSELKEKKRRYRDVSEELRKLMELQKEHNQALDKKRSDIKEKIRQQKQAKQMLLNEAEQWSSLIVTHNVPCTPSQQRVLLENKGQKLKKLSEETKAEVSVSKAISSVVIRGTEEQAALALEEVQQLLEKTSDREESTVRFKPDMVDVLLQKQTLTNLKTQTKAKLYIDKLDGVIRIETEKSNMSNAKKIVTNFLTENAQLELSVPVDSEAASILINSTKRIRDASRVSRVFVDLKSSTVQLSGRGATVRKAKEVVEQLVAQMKENKEVLKVSKGDVGQVIGKGGATLRSIEEKSGAFLSIDSNKPIIVLRGSSESIDKAKKEIAKVIPPKKSETNDAPAIDTTSPSE